jgi:two-component system sensor histidine kinase KdpD
MMAKVRLDRHGVTQVRAGSLTSRTRLASLGGYLGALVVIALCTSFSMAGASILQTAAFAVAFPFAVLVVTARFGVGPAILAGAAGALVFDFVFVPPPMEFTALNLKDGLTLALMLVVAAGASVLVTRLRHQAQSARCQVEAERLRNALLNAVSHDLRTPLTAIVGASTALCEGQLDAAERLEFSHMMAYESRRLSRLVANLLDLARLESGRSTNGKAPQAIDEIIGSALCRLERQLQGRQVCTDVREDIPFAAFDPVLIEQVLVNLVENVVRHAGATSPIEIVAREDDGEILVEVSDRGPGVVAGDEERVFEKLYRGRNPTNADGGVGLGLTICRAIVTAHQGRIWMENRSGGGAVVRFTLPLRDASPPLRLRSHEPALVEPSGL